MISLALVSALVTGIVAYQQAASAMRDEAKAKLFAVLESREAALALYFNTIRKDVRYHAQSPLIVEAFSAFADAWSSLPDPRADYLQRHYIDLNPYGVGLKANLLRAADDSHYSNVHKRFHTLFSNLRAARDFHDIFLIDPDGNVLYTAVKERDFGTNLEDGRWRTSSLARVFRAIAQTPTVDAVAFADFSAYAPSAGAPASFIAAPVFDPSLKYLGVLAFQMPIDAMNEVMQVTAGLGDTGETYLVGSDRKMRSDSRFYAGRSILVRDVDTEQVRAALAGEEGVLVAADYREQPVYSAFKPFQFLDTRWALLAEIDEAEVLAPVYRLNRLLTISGVVIALAITLLGYLLAIDLAQPIITMTKAMSRLSNNDLTVNISVSERRDEVGGMARAIIRFKDFAIERERLRERLSYMAQHDALTGLPNREFAMRSLEEMLYPADNQAHPVTLMFADLDGFKMVNDTYGHQAGDQLLKEIASRFAYCLRPEDMLARLGGDEFLIVLPETSERAECERIAERLLSSLQKSFVTSDSKYEVGVSIGVATFPTDATSVATLMKAADEAMYEAKEGGKNRYAFAGGPSGIGTVSQGIQGES
ncbi:MAG: diguanylate cyclase [Pseudomonadota bacterium]